MKQLNNINDLYKGLNLGNSFKSLGLQGKYMEIGFNKAVFPILIFNNSNYDFVYSLDDFLMNPELCCHKFDKKTKIIDSKGQQFNCCYDHLLNVYYPDKLEKNLIFEDVKQIMNDLLSNLNKKPEIDNETSIKVIFDKVIDHLMKNY